LPQTHVVVVTIVVVVVAAIVAVVVAIVAVVVAPTPRDGPFVLSRKAH
jgi:hypothetical protein